MPTPLSPTEAPRSSRSLPLWVVLLAGALLLGVGLTCRETFDSAGRAALYESASGDPLDWPGNVAPCPACPGQLETEQGPYRMRCTQCGGGFLVRRVEYRFRYEPLGDVATGPAPP